MTLRWGLILGALILHISLATADCQVREIQVFPRQVTLYRLIDLGQYLHITATDHNGQVISNFIPTYEVYNDFHQHLYGVIDVWENDPFTIYANRMAMPGRYKLLVTEDSGERCAGDWVQLDIR